MSKKDSGQTLREHYRDMSADKARKAAAARISGTPNGSGRAGSR